MTDTEAKVALAICLDDDPELCRNGCVHPAAGSVCPYLSAARAAIDAMLADMAEPSEGMVRASSRGDANRAGVYWRAMLAQYRKENLP